MSCETCPEGYISKVANSKNCSICEIGETSVEGSSTCSGCDLGTFGLVAGEKCVECPLGKYEDARGQLQCQDCPSKFAFIPFNDIIFTVYTILIYFFSLVLFF